MSPVSASCSVGSHSTCGIRGLASQRQHDSSARRTPGSGASARLRVRRVERSGIFRRALGKRRGCGAVAALPEAAALTATFPAADIAADLLARQGAQSDVAAQALWELGALGDDLSMGLFAAAQSADSVVASQLTTITPVTFAVTLVAGLVTSLSPCTLSVLPLTIGYIGGYSSASSSDGQGSDNSLALNGTAFAAGLASTLAALGVSAAALGKAYGQVGILGEGLPLLVSVLAVLMGLNLLEVVTVEFPSFGADFDARKMSIPPPAQAYLAGLTFALAASPCSTPVLATLLGYVASSGDPVQGGALLLTYTSGYVMPLLAAATFTGSLKRIMTLRNYSAWVSPASGFLLVAGGTYAFLSRVVPAGGM